MSQLNPSLSDIIWKSGAVRTDAMWALADRMLAICDGNEADAIKMMKLWLKDHPNDRVSSSDSRA